MFQNIISRFDPTAGTLHGGALVTRRLSDLRGIFADEEAYRRALAGGDPVVYTVESMEPGDGDGDLHYGIGRIMPGRIGDEFYMTKGHLHAWRPAAEVYIGLSGSGTMMMEDEATGESALLPLEPNGIVYVPGRTAHRTINTGSEPLTYIGIFPARAGHDYGAIAERNFRMVVAASEAGAEAIERERFIKMIRERSPE
ncbi:MAG: hypothetical protein JWQ98_2669 [Chlorobi bacterium]|nr:hypothetical protein [Chlorobiota bacterium]